jgi:uncharacterized protein with HEPN domain
MGKGPAVYLLHIRDSISAIEEFMSGIDEEAFMGNRMLRDAVVRNLEIIGEATKQLPIATREKEPAIEWKNIAGMRDVLAHDYFGVDMKRVLGVVHNRLPALKKAVENLLNTEASQREKRK